MSVDSNLLGVGDASPEVFSRFTFCRLDDGVLVFDISNGETSLLPFDSASLFAFLSERLPSDLDRIQKFHQSLCRAGLFFDC